MKNDLKNDFKETEPIMDSVYGIINISQFEKRLISTKEMQRLRGIKQLGFVNLVYPDAEHSRFAHSIGVCHQSKTIIDQVSKNILNNARYQRWRTKFKTEIKKEPVYAPITEIEKIVISAAALLHDLPHSPFSHEIETSDEHGNGIPVHDEYKNNPIFFSYLFDLETSDLAKVINIYNESFWELIKEDKKWAEILIKHAGIENGYVKISDEKDAILVSKIVDRKLPLLGVMIFEILLFDKMDMWAKIENDNSLIAIEEGIEISINQNPDKIKWKPIKDWFRPYRKDIVANTICSDLLDYLLRDGRNTGIIPSLDLKFFDRMTIAKAIPEKTNTLISLSKIPDFCEHIVFDIYDHKRGVIRQSIITEIVAFLQQRYLLAERVYNHRVVEGARAMLQDASRFLTSKKAISSKELHDTNAIGNSPINDEAFFSWVLDIKPGGQTEIIKAQNLIRMLRERRIYREIVIIDGILGAHKGSFRGTDVDCKTLADVLLNDSKRKIILDGLNKKVIEYCTTNKIENIPDPENEVLFTIGVRKFGKRYKIPRVLVAKPLNNDQSDDIEIFPLFEGKKLPAIDGRLESMQRDYDGLWKVFLFIHPFFHQKTFIQLHKNVAETFISLLYQQTNIQWANSIENYDHLLPENAIDVKAFVKENSLAESSIEKDDIFVLKIIENVNKLIPAEHDEFKLSKELHLSLLKTKFKKLGGEKNIFENAILQQKVIDKSKKFKYELSEAARDKEELIVKQLITQIELIISDEKDPKLL